MNKHLALARRARLRLLQMHRTAGVGHIGGNLSSLDAILYLHNDIMQESDLFVLSKGHSAGALYVALWAIGEISDAQLDTFHQDGTQLAGHPVAGWHGRIAFATGSLGHGLALAAGAALEKRLAGDDTSRVFCLLSDGECQEGSIWEALIFARHQKLSNLLVLVDANGLQGFGTTAEVATMEPWIDRFSGFGLAVSEIDGHDPAALDAALRCTQDGPKVVILHTVKGRGVPFMEGRMEWHYLPMNDEQYQAAVTSVSAS